MDALSTENYKVWFGGGYTEHWSEDYSLSVSYHDRHYVEAVCIGGKWMPTGGDEELLKLLLSPDCPEITATYFQAAAQVYAAVHDCLKRGLTPDRLGECFHNSDNPLAAPELMRLLMDDCGFSLERAYRVAAYCCDALGFEGISPDMLYPLQPRTAHVVGIMRHLLDTLPALIHDSRQERFRSPGSTVPSGSGLRLAFLRKGGKINHAELVLWGDDFERSFELEQSGNIYYVNLMLPGTAQALWYAFYVETDTGAFWLCPDATGFIGRLYPKREDGFRLTVYDRGFETPAWFRRTVMYQIFPDRFAFSDDGTAERGIEYHKSLGQSPELHKSIGEAPRWKPREFETEYSPDDFYGGSFKGIEAKLPYLKELGIGCLYLNPIVEARSNHRYDTSDYTRPDPILGTTEDFKRLCSAAAEMGIRIILDGVYSHTGCDSRYFNRYGHYDEIGACQGETSKYYPWFDFKHFPDKYRCWWGFKDLPEVNEKDPDWQDYIISGENSIVKTWLRRGASGWRLDVADELPDEILSMIRTAVKGTDIDAPIIGEVWEDAVIKESYGARRRYALGSALDSVMNYPLRTAVLDFVHGRTDAYGLRDFLISQQMNYPKPMYYSLMNLLGSHDVARLRNALALDVNLRKLSREEQMALDFSPEALGKALQLERMCAALQFSLPGVPSIYYGDEQGMTGVGDPFNRAPFAEGDRDLHDYYASLASLRNSAAALSVGHVLFAAEDSDVLLVLRYISDGRDAFGLPAENGAYLTVLNRSAETRHYSADCSAAGAGIYCGIAAPMSGEIIKLQ